MTVQARISQGISVVMIGKKAGGFAGESRVCLFTSVCLGLASPINPMSQGTLCKKTFYDKLSFPIVLL